MTTLSDLRKLAEAATPGPWRSVNERILSKHDAKVANVILSTHDAAYIAALSPERVLAMIECIEAADAYAANPTSNSGAIYRMLRARLEQEQSR